MVFRALVYKVKNQCDIKTIIQTKSVTDTCLLGTNAAAVTAVVVIAIAQSGLLSFKLTSIVWPMGLASKAVTVNKLAPYA